MEDSINNRRFTGAVFQSNEATDFKKREPDVSNKVDFDFFFEG